MNITPKNSVHNTVIGAFSEEKSINPRLLSPLALAYIGDTIFDLYIRTYLLHHTSHTVHGLHIKATKMVNAKAQARAYEMIENTLTEEEQAVFKRGRNAHNGTVPKSATIKEYKTATGLETLIGYLY
ncbi:MAG: ribonuclease III, partial [Clostridiales bacterium]|nr:ribonuclease III [Clostridiales bacterium]